MTLEIPEKIRNLISVIEIPYFKNQKSTIDSWLSIYNTTASAEEKYKIFLLMYNKNIGEFHHSLYCLISQYFIAQNQPEVSCYVLRKAIFKKVYDSVRIKEELKIAENKLLNKKSDFLTEKAIYKILHPRKLFLWNKEWIKRNMRYFYDFKAFFDCDNRVFLSKYERLSLEYREKLKDQKNSIDIRPNRRSTFNFNLSGLNYDDSEYVIKPNSNMNVSDIIEKMFDDSISTIEEKLSQEEKCTKTITSTFNDVSVNFIKKDKKNVEKESPIHTDNVYLDYKDIVTSAKIEIKSLDADKFNNIESQDSLSIIKNNHNYKITDSLSKTYDFNFKKKIDEEFCFSNDQKNRNTDVFTTSKSIVTSKNENNVNQTNQNVLLISKYQANSNIQELNKNFEKNKTEFDRSEAKKISIMKKKYKVDIDTEFEINAFKSMENIFLNNEYLNLEKDNNANESKTDYFIDQKIKSIKNSGNMERNSSIEKPVYHEFDSNKLESNLSKKSQNSSNNIFISYIDNKEHPRDKYYQNKHNVDKNKQNKDKYSSVDSFIDKDEGKYMKNSNILAEKNKYNIDSTISKPVDFGLRNKNTDINTIHLNIEKRNEKQPKKSIISSSAIIKDCGNTQKSLNITQKTTDHLSNPKSTKKIKFKLISHEIAIFTSKIKPNECIEIGKYIYIIKSQINNSTYSMKQILSKDESVSISTREFFIQKISLISNIEKLLEIENIDLPNFISLCKDMKSYFVIYENNKFKSFRQIIMLFIQEYGFIDETLLFYYYLQICDIIHAAMNNNIELIELNEDTLFINGSNNIVFTGFDFQYNLNVNFQHYTILQRLLVYTDLNLFEFVDKDFTINRNSLDQIRKRIDTKLLQELFIKQNTMLLQKID